MVWSLTHILTLVAGAGVVASGLGVLWGHRIVAHEGGEAEVEGKRWAGPGWLTQQMRLVLGPCLMIGGYHLAAYGSPDAWFPLKVARELWWVVPAGIGVCVGATAWLDRIAARGG